MVREACVRPAHFLPQPFFKPFNRYKSVLVNDTARVRAANKSLHSHFENNNNFIMYLGKFLAASANQLAFSKIFRIAHGAYSPSNICYDGRWLDLTNLSMVPTGVNYSAAQDTTPFLLEPKEPISIVEQAAYNYGKYNYVDLTMAPLISYYYEQFNSYFLHYLASLFGLDYRKLEHSIATPERQLLAELVSHTINGNKQVTVGFPDDLDKEDILQPILETLFASLTRPEFNYTTGKNSIKPAMFKAFYSLFSQAYSHIGQPQSEHSFVISAMIRALRKLYFAPFFYLARMHRHIKAFAEQAEPEEFQDYIDSYSHIAGWLFDKLDSDEKITLFDNSLLAIHYLPNTNSYNVLGGISEASYCKTPQEVIQHIKMLDDHHFNTAGYNFKPGVRRLLEMLSRVVDTAIFNTTAVKEAETL